MPSLNNLHPEWDAKAMLLGGEYIIQLHCFRITPPMNQNGERDMGWPYQFFDADTMERLSPSQLYERRDDWNLNNKSYARDLLGPYDKRLTDK